MLLEFYSLKEHPFEVLPDPAYLFLSRSHREALVSLFHAIDTDQTFVALVAPPGMGKTTLLLRLMERLSKGDRTAFLFKNQCDSREILRCLLTGLGRPPQDLDLVVMHLQLNELLLQQAWNGKPFVIIIDEAHQLEDEVLVTIRLLSYLGTPDKKLVQIVLAGRPQMAGKLACPGLQQLVRWVSVMARLEPFSTRESRRYIEHRLKVAGYEGPELFTDVAISLIAHEGRGIPLLINAVCSQVLSLGFSRQQRTIDGPLVRYVLADLDLRALLPEPSVPLMVSEVASTPDSPPRPRGATQTGLDHVTTGAHTPISPATKPRSREKLVQSSFTRWLEGMLDEQTVPPEKSAGTVSPQFRPSEGIMGGISSQTYGRENAIGDVHIRAFPGVAKPHSREDFEKTPFARWLQGIKDAETSALTFSKEVAGSKGLSRAAAAAQSISSMRVTANESPLLDGVQGIVSAESSPRGQEWGAGQGPEDIPSPIARSSNIAGDSLSSASTPEDIQVDSPMAKAADRIIPVERGYSPGVVQEVPPFLLTQPPTWLSRLFPFAAVAFVLILAGGLVRHYLNRTPFSTGDEDKVKTSSQVTGGKDQSSPAGNQSTVLESPPDHGEAPQGGLAVSQLNTGEQDRSPQFLTVIVRPQQNLRRICLHYLGCYNSKLVNEIKRLNPQLKDPNYVQVGQRLRLPVRAANEWGNR
jgi:general secretion pathway protein A